MAIARNGSVWLNWRATGPPDGEPVLLIMGLAGSSRMWWRFEPQLAAEHRTILFDNRGTGDSDGVSGPMSMAAMVDDALAVLDAAGHESAHVFGVSMGGMIAQYLALDHRSRVRSLLLGCTTPGGRRGAPPWRMVASTAVRPVLGPKRTFELVAPLLYAPRTLRDHPGRLREDLRVRAADMTSPATYYAQIAAVARHDTRARLHELGGLPVTVVHGEEDGLVPVEQGRKLAAGIPGARFVGIPGCGHLMTTDAEPETVAAVLGHLERATASSPAAAGAASTRAI